MNLRVLFLTLSIFTITLLSAQSNNPVIMTINGNPVLKSEFEYIYNKNNANNAIDKKTLEEYVDLFINFKLKVEEAKAQGLDTTKAFVNELRGYRTQLAKPYLIDEQADKDVLKEAYERMKEDVDVSHILINIDVNAPAADTLTAWNKAQKILKRLQKEDFAKVAKEVSDDQSVVQNGGHIGWITSFRTIYPFETAAYNMPVGSVSQPVRTMFGYHIIKVHNRRNTLGEMQTSHIMKFTSDDETANKIAKAQIDSLYQRVLTGEDFGSLAEAHSDDKGSSVNKGELPWFGTGHMVPEFEAAAFALKNKGDISKPIRSAYGWHIIKFLDKRELASYEGIKPELQRQIKRDERRANRGKEAFVEKLKKTYSVKENTENLQDFYSLLDGRTLSDSTFIAKAAALDKPLLNIADQTRTQVDFATYLKINNQSRKTVPSEIIDEKFAAFVNNELLAYEDSQLEKKHEDFRFLMQEYHDGSLLFEVSNKEVWSRSSKDTEGLKQFFAENKNAYKWDKPHYKGRVIFCKDEATLKAAKAIAKRINQDSIDKYLPERLNDSIQYVKIQKGIFAQGDNKVVDKQFFKVKNVELSGEYPYAFLVGKDLKFMPESYLDVRGRVTADYQEHLEKEWIRALREKYPVTVDEKVLKTVKKN